MFIIWLLPVWGTRNKCRTHDLTVIRQASKKKVFIGARKQWHIKKAFRESKNDKFAILKKVYSVKTKSTVSQLFNVTLEYIGNRILCLSRNRFHLSTAKGKETFQGKFVVIVEGFAR